MLDIEQFAESGELFDGHYKLIRPLSTDGATADVWTALDTNTMSDISQLNEIEGLTEDEIEAYGLVIAIKIYRPHNALDIEGEQRFRDEYMIVFNCHHTNLIHPTHFSIFQGIPYLVLPYCRFGSSERLIGREIDENEIWKYILDVSSGLAYLHALQPPIIHQDIKPGNILIDDNNNFAITDFGISSKRGGQHGYYEEENSGTMAYMAPERFEEEVEPEPESDIWAVGATLCEILTGNVPFGEEGGWAQLQDATIGMPALPKISPDLQRLIYACLAKDKTQRPTAQQLIESAKAKQYPIKSKKSLYITLIIIGILLIGGLSFGLTRFFTEPEVVVTPPVQETPINERYDAALRNMNSENLDSLNKGLLEMEKLAGDDYVPALYQMAFTYGWYSDSISVKRKQMLGIEMDETYIPKSDRYSNKAVAFFTRIMELNDSTYADLNANATYRLACYYVMPNSIYQPNYEKGKRYLLRSKEWATIAGDQTLIEKIDRGLATFE
ncbi:MAG: serine/threonine protein kinase [Bacteroidaceae bacterium]|nr:serine/threonine protein kinase [Bacteroidaceae bacterium]